MTASRPHTCSSLKRATEARDTSSSPDASAAYTRARPRAVDVAPVDILVVDDDTLVSTAVREKLEADGHRVTVAAGGQEGIDVFRAAKACGDPFRVVITDLGMPHVDGRQVSEEVKVTSPGTPVILLTGWGQRLLATDIPPTVDYVLSKPPTGRGLRSALAKCLESEENTAAQWP